MSVMTIAEFQANCLEVIGEVDATGEPVIIMKDGAPIAMLFSAQRKPKSALGIFRGAISMTDDLIEPADYQQALS